MSDLPQAAYYANRDTRSGTAAIRDVTRGEEILGTDDLPGIRRSVHPITGHLDVLLCDRPGHLSAAILHTVLSFVFQLYGISRCETQSVPGSAARGAAYRRRCDRHSEGRTDCELVC